MHIITSRSVPQLDVSASHAVHRNTDIFKKDLFTLLTFFTLSIKTIISFRFFYILFYALYCIQVG